MDDAQQPLTTRSTPTMDLTLHFTFVLNMPTIYDDKRDEYVHELFTAVVHDDATLLLLLKYLAVRKLETAVDYGSGWQQGMIGSIDHFDEIMTPMLPHLSPAAQQFFQELQQEPLDLSYNPSTAETLYTELVQALQPYINIAFTTTTIDVPELDIHQVYRRV